MVNRHRGSMLENKVTMLHYIYMIGKPNVIYIYEISILLGVANVTYIELYMYTVIYSICYSHERVFIGKLPWGKLI